MSLLSNLFYRVNAILITFPTYLFIAEIGNLIQKMNMEMQRPRVVKSICENHKAKGLPSPGIRTYLLNNNN